MLNMSENSQDKPDVSIQENELNLLLEKEGITEDDLGPLISKSPENKKTVASAFFTKRR